MATCRVVLIENAEPASVEVLIRPLGGGPTVRRVVMLTTRATDTEPELTATVVDEDLEPQDPVVVAGIYTRRATGGVVSSRSREEVLASMTDEARRLYLARRGKERAKYINLDGEALYLVQLDELWTLPSGLTLPNGSHIMVAPDELPKPGEEPVVVDFESWDASAESYVEFIHRQSAGVEQDHETIRSVDNT